MLKISARVLLSVAAVVCLCSCSTILGPPGSESDIPPTSLSFGPYDMAAEGSPNPNFLNVEGGCYIWRNGDSWHVRFAKSEKTRYEYPNYPIFSGGIVVEDGFIQDFSRFNTTMRDDIKLGHKDMLFHFELNNAVEGFDFRVRPLAKRYCVTFDIRENDVAMTKMVHLGRNLFTPDMMPLTICSR